MSKPDRINRFWMGRDIRPEYAHFESLWRRAAPRAAVHTWGFEEYLGESIIRESVASECFRAFPGLRLLFVDLAERDAGRNGIEYAVQIADVVGYMMAWQFGGMYVNCDIEPVRWNFELPDQAWASYENDIGDVVNAAIGAPAPRDPFWHRALAGLTEHYFAHPGAEMVKQTGPGYLTALARAHPDELTILPVTAFNPVHWRDVAPGGDASEHVRSVDWSGTETIGVHHWGHKRDGRTNMIESATT